MLGASFGLPLHPSRSRRIASPELRVQNVPTAAKVGHWTLVPHPRSYRHGHARRLQLRGRKETDMPNIFYIIGVVVVVFAILDYLGLR